MGLGDGVSVGVLANGLPIVSEGVGVNVAVGVGVNVSVGDGV